MGECRGYQDWRRKNEHVLHLPFSQGDTLAFSRGTVTAVVLQFGKGQKPERVSNQV